VHVINYGLTKYMNNQLSNSVNQLCVEKFRIIGYDMHVINYRLKNIWIVDYPLL